jgi:protein-tyrosine-phosphatase
MASALFAAQIQGLTDAVEVSSAGLPGDVTPGRHVPEEVLGVMAPYGIDLRGHRSREITQTMLAGSDLVVGLARRHVQEAMLLDPPCWPKAFTLKEVVRRGNDVGRRHPDQDVRSWIDSVHGDRTRASIVHRSPADDVADPYGGSLARYRSTAVEVARLVARLAELLWSEGDLRPEP